MDTKGPVSPIVLLVVLLSIWLALFLLQPHPKDVLPSVTDPETQTTQQPLPTVNTPSITTNNMLYKTWPIKRVCLGGGQIPNDPKTPVVVLDLGDRTYIYKGPDGSLFRGTQNNCESSSAL